MMTLNFNPFPELLSERLLLRRINQNDRNEIFLLRSDPIVMKYIDRPPAESITDAEKFISLINDLEKDNKAITWGITLKGNPKLIGTICYWNILEEHFRAEVGYVLLPDFHGKGIMHEAMKQVLEYGFYKMMLHSVEANVNPQNIASIKLLEKNNFTREAYFKENYYYNGRFLDSAIYSLLVQDYEIFRNS